MKFVRLVAAPLPFMLFITHGCSDPPAPPAQAAVTLKISPAPGEACVHTNGVLSMPSANNTGVLDALNCDLSTGCKPDEYVVVDRDRGSTVQCEVSADGSNFKVLLNLIVDGTSTVGAPSMSFGVSGVIGPTGGMASVTEQNSVAKGGGSDNTCIITIQPNYGAINKGKIWASFVCNAFRDTKDLSDTGCKVEGNFLFENCSG